MNAVYFPSGSTRSTSGTSAARSSRLGRSRSRGSSSCPRRTVLRPAPGRRLGHGRPRSERIRVYSLHLPSPLAISGGSRRDELRALALDAASAEGPVVIAGDFNSHDKVEELAKAGFAWVTRDVGPTARLRLLGIGLAGLSYDHVLAKGLRPVAARGRRASLPTTAGRATTSPSGVLH